jgi:2-amino-4-hydroxy-6-hydroxymethyldihydropteridine diphosphokinase
VDEVAAGEPHRLSYVYETDPVGGVAQDDFWNLVLELETTASPRELLARCQRGEARAARVRDVRWGPRTLDCDVLLIEGYTSTDVELTVPHPRMFERCFVLAPLRELRPDLVSDEMLDAAHGNVRRLATLSDVAQ